MMELNWWGRLRSRIVFWTRSLICRIDGHAWMLYRDENPEYGYICRRCHIDKTVTLL